MNFERAVIKVGSALVAPDNKGCSGKYTLAIAQFITNCHQQGREVILVSSGGVAAGRSLVKHGTPKLSVATKKAMASVGQMKMMTNWQRLFDVPCSQILITQSDLSDRERNISVKETINIHLKNGIIPIVNENDALVTADLTIGDNDNLAALVAQVCDADTLYILSDIDGVFTKDPNIHSDAVLLPSIETISDEIYAMAGTSRNPAATGGMKTKIQAAEKAVEFGINTYILNGTKSDVFTSLLAKTNPGTHFTANTDGLTSKKHWLKHTLKSKGAITLDDGAVRALTDYGASLLPSGILSIDTEFKAGDAIDLIASSNNTRFAKGVSLFNSKDLAKIKGKHSDDIHNILGKNLSEVVIRRDDLVLL